MSPRARTSLRVDPDFQALVPKLSAEERAGLEADIIRDGRATVPLIVWHDILLDGHNRLEICRERGLPFATQEPPEWVQSRLDAEIWILQTSLHRRNMPELDRIAVISKLEPRIAEKNREAQEASRAAQPRDKRGRLRSPPVQNSAPPAARKTRAIAAAQAGVSHPTYTAGKTVNEKAVPELREAVARGDIAISTGAELCSLPKAKQREVAKAGPKAARKAASAQKAEKRRQKQREREKRQQEALKHAAADGPSATIIHATISDAKVDAGSVDVIITDPPYERESLPLYSDLSAFAADVLKPGGLCVVMCGQSYLPEVLRLLEDWLTYRWTAAYLTPGGQAVQLWDRKVNTFWKPLVILSNGELPDDARWIGDVCRSETNDNDKRFHEWGQSESGMRDVVERFSEPGQLLCDPFCGAGTTGIVAKALGRRFLGIDADARACATARRRLAA